MSKVSCFKISSRDKPFTSDLEVEAVLVECAVNKFVSIPAEPGIILTQPVAVDFLTSWCGANVLIGSFFCSFLFRHACVTCRYDFIACTTQSFGFYW